MATSDRKFMDMGFWEQLAADANLRLPRGDAKYTTGAMERWLRRLGIPVAAYLVWDGSKSLREFVQRNPSWTYRAWAGLVLEHRGLILRLWAREGCQS